MVSPPVKMSFDILTHLPACRGVILLLIVHLDLQFAQEVLASLEVSYSSIWGWRV